MYCRFCGTPIRSRSLLDRCLQPFDFALKGRQDVRKQMASIMAFTAGTVILGVVVFILVKTYFGLLVTNAPFAMLWSSLILVGLGTGVAVFRSKKLTQSRRQSNIANPVSTQAPTVDALAKVAEIEGQVSLVKNEVAMEKAVSKERMTAALDSLDLRRPQLGGVGKTSSLGNRKSLIVASSLGLLMLGCVALFEAVVSSSTVLAFIGLGFTFWGLLFLFVRATSFAKAELIDSTALSSIQTIDRILNDLKYYGRGIYLMSETNEEVRLFVPASKDSTNVPPPGAIGDSIFVSDPRGLLLLPPGMELARLFLDHLTKHDKKLTLKKLQERLPWVLTHDLEIMEGFEIRIDGDMVHTKSVGSLYSDFCNEVRLKTRVCQAFGCPVCSAIACLLVKSTRSPVMLEHDESKPDGHIESSYRILRRPASNPSGAILEPVTSVIRKT